MGTVAAVQLARTVGVVTLYGRFLTFEFGRQNAQTVNVA
jgi:hypothetical protein